MSERRDCGACLVPLGGPGCGHVWQHDGEVTMSVESWHGPTNTLDALRRAFASAAPDEYEDFNL